MRLYYEVLPNSPILHDGESYKGLGFVLTVNANDPNGDALTLTPEMKQEFLKDVDLIIGDGEIASDVGFEFVTLLSKLEALNADVSKIEIDPIHLIDTYGDLMPIDSMVLYLIIDKHKTNIYGTYKLSDIE